MLHREIIANCSEIRYGKHKLTLQVECRIYGC